MRQGRKESREKNEREGGKGEKEAGKEGGREGDLPARLKLGAANSIRSPSECQ